MYLKIDTKIYFLGVDSQPNSRKSFYEDQIEYLYSIESVVRSIDLRIQKSGLINESGGLSPNFR